MATTDVKIELEVDLSLIPNYAIVLDDPIRGVLDSTAHRLGGVGFYNVSEYFQSMSVSRGKSRELDEYESGDAQVRFNNSQRAFDPKYQLSPFYGSIVPRLPIRISVNDILAYTGIVRDWNIGYDPGGASYATAVCSDRFTILAQAPLTLEYNDVQFSGQRINEILSRPEVDWSLTERNIDTGETTLSADLIAEGTAALSYFRQVETTEQGQLFIAKNGYLTFRSRNDTPQIAATFADDGTGIPYLSVSVVYGSELLYNRIEIIPDGLDPVIVDDAISQSGYGISALTLNTLHEYETDAQDMANYMLASYAQPEFRFEQVTIQLGDIPSGDVEDILNIELGDLIGITFTPSRIPPAIVEYARVVGLEHEAEALSHEVRVRLASLAVIPFVLDSEALGVLDTSSLGY